MWSVTVGPLVPDFYSYAFNVDGVKTVDPRNARIKQGITSLDSLFRSQAKKPRSKKRETFPMATSGKSGMNPPRSAGAAMVHVYTPPGYDSSSQRYSVFYLLHGAGDEDSGWSTVGRAGFIIDNLLAAGKAKPMIVVMPNGSLPRPTTAGNGPGAPGGDGRLPRPVHE